MAMSVVATIDRSKRCRCQENTNDYTAPTFKTYRHLLYFRRNCIVAQRFLCTLCYLFNFSGLQCIRMVTDCLLLDAAVVTIKVFYISFWKKIICRNLKSNEQIWKILLLSVIKYQTFCWNTVHQSQRWYENFNMIGSQLSRGMHPFAIFTIMKWQTEHEFKISFEHQGYTDPCNWSCPIIECNS